MDQAIVIREPGGPDVLKSEQVTIGEPGNGQVRLRQNAIGVNFHDCYVRSGSYKTLALPGIPGLEERAYSSKASHSYSSAARGYFYPPRCRIRQAQFD
jgi:NADPH2:quinone reductase